MPLGHGLLRCPVCRLDLAAAPGSLVCPNRHSFDLAREGYVNLLRGGRHQPAVGGDSSAQLERRRTFLGAGHFDAITSVIAKHVQHEGMTSERRCWHVLDGGFGTGHHLVQTEAALSLPVVGLGLDISKHAARRAARQWPKLAFAVADLWAEWPVRRKRQLTLCSASSRPGISLRPHGCSGVADGLLWHIRGQSIFANFAIVLACSIITGTKANACSLQSAV